MTALLTMIRRRLAVTWLGYCLAALFALMIPITNLVTLQTAMGTLRFVAMDSRDTFYLANLGNFETTQKIHAEIAKMAAEAIYSRNPDGYDYAERMERLFTPAALIALNTDGAKDATAYHDQGIHQKVETGHIEEIAIDSNTAKVSVECQLLRTGTFNGRLFSDPRRVTMFFMLQTNASMAQNGMYPLVVTAFKEHPVE